MERPSPHCRSGRGRAWDGHGPGGQVADARLATRIRAVHQESDGTYGSPRITAELREASSEVVNHKLVARIMRASGIDTAATRGDVTRWTSRTTFGAAGPPAPLPLPRLRRQRRPARTQPRADRSAGLVGRPAAGREAGHCPYEEQRLRCEVQGVGFIPPMRDRKLIAAVRALWAGASSLVVGLPLGSWRPVPGGEVAQTRGCAVALCAAQALFGQQAVGHGHDHPVRRRRHAR
ncbi:transposase [Streptomyces parvulus]|uniref:Transposase n=1 Tax=Streptomyces parvulus TaxID=146923 RepID=A0A369V298_9ACTN|nr:transposase [Streptomyces parvulus]